MNTWAVLCPGQGAQHREMFALSQTWFDEHLQSSLQTLPPLAHLFAQTELLFANRHAQPLVVAATLANWHSLQNCWYSQMQTHLMPNLVAGYSVGELAACSVAGMLRAEDCVHLAMQRAIAMDACGGPHVMAAISFNHAQEVKSLLQEIDEVALAIHNGERQWIMAGTAQGMLALEQRVQQLGGSWRALNVQVASHTPLMQAALAPFNADLSKLRWQQASCPILAGSNAQANQQIAAVQAALLQQMTSCIAWAACMDALWERGVRVALELGPGAQLTSMLQARHPDIAVRSISQFSSMAGVAKWLERQLMQ